MKVDCIFCTSPFQIMTAIHLCMKCEKDKQMDLYIIDQFKNVENVFNKLRNIKIFRNVILIHEYEIVDKSNKAKWALWPQMILAYIRLNKTAKKLLKENSNIHYDIMYVSSKAFTSRLIAMYYAKNSFGTELVYFDDGLGSYFDKRILYPRMGDRILRWLLVGKKANILDPKKIMLYNPELFEVAGVNVKDGVKVEKIPKWDRNGLFKEYVNEVFSYTKTENIKEQIIIFDGLYNGEQKSNIEKFYYQVAEVAGVQNVIIKKHPRDTSSTNCYGLLYYERADIPFELLCLNTNMTGKLLITISSTAVITPKILFNEEPYVLTLNEISGFPKSTLDVRFDNFKKMYAKQDKFKEARSEKDALNYIKQYNNLSD